MELCRFPFPPHKQNVSFQNIMRLLIKITSLAKNKSLVLEKKKKKIKLWLVEGWDEKTKTSLPEMAVSGRG